VKSQFDLGVKLGVTGTPTIITEDGTVIGGYLTPEQMLEAVRKHSAG
jgi:thiol:disulfide interchange protein DsbC